MSITKTYKSRAIKCQFWNDTLPAKKLKFRHESKTSTHPTAAQRTRQRTRPPARERAREHIEADIYTKCYSMYGGRESRRPAPTHSVLECPRRRIAASG